MPYPIKGEQRNTGRTHFKKGHKPKWTGQKGWTNKSSFKKGHKYIPAENEKSKGHNGKNHHNWKGGITSEAAKIRHSEEYDLWRKAVYERDNWTCQICGKKCGRDIVAHHIFPFKDYPHLRFAVNNGVTLHRKCHTKLHKKKD